MSGELFMTATKELLKIGTDILHDGCDIAELGSIKPLQYGTLIRQKFQEGLLLSVCSLIFHGNYH